MSSYEQSVTLLRRNKRSMAAALRSLGFDVSDDMRASEFPKYVRLSGGLMDVKVAVLRQSDSKKLYYTKEEWQEMLENGGTEGLLVRGVRVRADGLCFLIGGETRFCAFSPQQASGLDAYNGAAGAYMVGDARGRTETIATAMDGKSGGGVNGAPAAEFCLSYTAFSSDTSEWAIPTVRHLHVMYRYRAQIDEVISVAFGAQCMLVTATLVGAQFWSCLEMNNNSAWVVMLSGGYTTGVNKNVSYYVRPIAED